MIREWGLYQQLGRLLSRFSSFVGLGGVSAVVDDSPGWVPLGRTGPNDLDYSERIQLYQDALEATRKNPLAKTIVDITTDFVLGDGIQISSQNVRMERFIGRFWHHRQNQVDQRLQSLADELSRAGDIFVLLFRNPQDGMSYLRFVTKEQIRFIETAENDWETELAYHQVGEMFGGSIPAGDAPTVWLSPNHPNSAEAEAVMLHYAINRPVGAAFGQGDLDTIIPWLLRYSRMLEDRVRAHWATRAFLWFVRVPSHKVEAKREQYSSPPDPGSIVVHDEAESWDVKSPTLRASDAQHDLKAVRHMIDAAGYPPHWRGEAGDANLATATAMQIRPERHLRRRQNYLVFILQDILYHAFVRAHQLGKAGRGSLPEQNYRELFTVSVADVSRSDNRELAQAGQALATAFSSLFAYVPAAESPSLRRKALQLLFKFMGEPLSEGRLGRLERSLVRN
ncbi:MAG: hypothetical protein WAM60_09195 [Candidatus Promineifilaceae bacterium]